MNDGFWGIGPSGKGRSELGKILMRVRAGVQEVQQDEQQTHICAGNMTCKFLKKRELKRTGHLTSGVKADLVDCVLKVITTRRMWFEDLLESRCRASLS